MSLSTGILSTSPVPHGIAESLPLRRQDYLIDATHPHRRQVERFIAQRFLEMHGARISIFMPVLVALFDEDGEVRAAVGIRSAEAERLFLEYYLDESIERAISSHARQPLAIPSRERIVEIGNLASIDRRASRKLFQSPGRLAECREFRMGGVHRLHIAAAYVHHSRYRNHRSGTRAAVTPAGGPANLGWLL